MTWPFLLIAGIVASAFGLRRLLTQGTDAAPDFAAAPPPWPGLVKAESRTAFAAVMVLLGGLVGATLPFVPAAIGAAVGFAATPFGLSLGLGRWRKSRRSSGDPVVDEQIQGALDRISARRDELRVERRRAVHALAKVEIVIAATGSDDTTETLRERALAEITTLNEAVAALSARLTEDRIEALLVAWRRRLSGIARPTPEQVDAFRRAADHLLSQIDAGRIPIRIGLLARGVDSPQPPPDSAWEAIDASAEGQTRRGIAAARIHLEEFRRELVQFQRAVQLGEASAALGGSAGAAWRGSDDELVASLVNLDGALRAARPDRVRPDPAVAAPDELSNPSAASLALEALRARNRVVGDEDPSDRARTAG